MDEPTGLPQPPAAYDPAVLEDIQQRVLWLATRIVDAANHDRDTGDGVKVGGHQASSASLVTVMTALYFAYLDAPDRVSVKPHASPVFHAIQYLLGNLDRSYLTTLRAFGGLQSYPSRTKDPDNVDFSTGSVGLGAAAPLFAAAARRYVDAHFGARPRSRFIAIIGDAELDEGNIWEAVADPATDGLGDVLWIVDVNRQSLDRVVPGVRIAQWEQQFSAAGWHVVEAKYGRALQQAFAQPGGDALRAWIDAMPNEHYQSLFGLEPAAVRERFLDGAPPAVQQFCAGIPDHELAPLVTDLAGHDIGSLLAAFAECDAEKGRPSVLFAYTIKGWGLPIAGNPRNHSALLTTTQIAQLRDQLGLTEATEWDRLDPMTPAGQWAAARREHLARAPRTYAGNEVDVPDAVGLRAARPISTQEAFGRILVDLSRVESVAPYLVTTAPDVATSTNLAGFINRAGVFSPSPRRAWSEDPVLKWAEGPDGQHIELGISEMNLFLLLGQLGLTWDLSDQPLLPVGTVYDPFVLRGLDAFIYSVYSGARFIVAGTPSGVTLAPEGGAHQSTITASVGIELPSVTFIEPAYAVALDWLLCGALQSVARRRGSNPARRDRDRRDPARRAGRRQRATGGRLLLLPADDTRYRPGAVPGRAGPARRRDPPPSGAGRRLPARRRGRRRRAGSAGRVSRRLRRGAARGAAGRSRARRRGHRGNGRGRHLRRPPLPRLAADPAPGRAHRHGAVDPGGAAIRLPRPGARRDRSGCGIAHHELARLGARRPGRQPRRGHLRPVRLRRRPLPRARPRLRLDRQRRARRALSSLTRGGRTARLLVDVAAVGL